VSKKEEASVEAVEFVKKVVKSNDALKIESLRRYINNYLVHVVDNKVIKQLNCIINKR